MENQFKEQVLKIQKLEAAYVLFSARTKQPYVICDEESYNDQIWMYTAEEPAKAEAVKYRDQKIQLVIAKIEKDQLLGFLSGLYMLGINEVVFNDETESVKIPLDQIVIPPDYSKLPENQRPISNPQMQLTGIYFIQELARQVPMEEKKNIRDLEEEMAANLMRSRFLIAIEVDGETPKPDGSNVKFPCVKTKEDTMYQPIFTDMREFQKFNAAKKYKASLLTFDGVSKMIGNNVTGIVVNPHGINIVIPKANVPSIKDRFQ